MKRKNLFSALWAAILAGMLITAAVPSNVFAAGTTAGTVISAQASVQFNDGSNVRNKVSNTYTLTVRQTIAGAFSGGNTGSSSGLDHRTVTFPITFTNTGNQYDYFQVTFGTMPSGFSNPRLVEDLDSNGTVGGSDITLAANGVTSQEAVDKYRHFLISVDVDATPSNLSNNAIEVTLTSLSGDGTHPTLGSTAPQNQGATFTYTWTYQVKKPVITYSVAQTNPSPAIPGKTGGSWLVTYDNTGDADVVGATTLTITLPTELQGSATLSGATNGETAVYTPNGSGYSGTIAVTIPAAALTAAASAHTFTVPFTIEQTSNNGTGPLGTASVTTAATNFATTYSGDATANIYSAAAPSVTGTGTLPVDDSKGAKWTVFPATQTADANETIEAVLEIKNLGNTTTTFNLTQANGSGSDNVAHVFSMTSEGASITSTTPAIAPGATQTIYVRVTTPSSFTTGNTIERNLTVTSAAAGATDAIGMTAADYTKKITTSYGGSTLSVVLTSDASNPLPGDVITFTLTLTNSKAAAATNVLVTLPIDTHMTFKSGAFSSSDFEVDGTAGNGGGTISYAAGNITTTSAFSVPGSGTNGGQKVVKYKCTVN